MSAAVRAEGFEVPAMTPSGQGESVYPRQTDRSNYSYMFTAKHHGGPRSRDATWSINQDDEFAVFNTADVMELADDDGNLYGALREGENSLRTLGTWGQQIAEFPCASEGAPWHGYPIWAVNDEAPPHRRGEKYRPAPVVFRRMEASGLINRNTRVRLMGGHHV